MIGKHLIDVFGTNKTYISPSDPECLIYILIIAVLIYFFAKHSDIFSFTFGDLPPKEWHMTRALLYGSFILFIMGFFSLTLERNDYGATSGLIFVFSSIAILFIISRLPSHGLINGDAYVLLFATIAATVVLYFLTRASLANSPTLWLVSLILLFLSLWFMHSVSFFKGKYIRFTRKRNPEKILEEKLTEKGYETSVKGISKKYYSPIKPEYVLNLPKKDMNIYISQGMILFPKIYIEDEDMEEILDIIDKNIC